MIYLHADLNSLDTTAISNLFAVEQVVNFNTRGYSMLDLVFSDLIEYIDVGCKQVAPIYKQKITMCNIISNRKSYTIITI